MHAPEFRDLRIVLPSAFSAGLLCWSALHVVPAAFEGFRQSVTAQAEQESAQLFWFFDIAMAFRLYVAVMLFAGAAVWLFSGLALVGLLVPVLMVALPRLAWKAMRKRRQRRFDEQLPEALLIVAGALRAGLGLPAAVQQMTQEARAPLSQEFGLLLREQRLGMMFDLCLFNLGRRMPTASTTLMVSAMRVAAQSGGNLAQTLERVSTTLAMRLQMEAKVHALTAQGRMQSWVVGSLPALMLLVMAKLQPALVAVFWDTHAGWAALGVIVVLEVLGMLAIRRIVHIDI